MSFGSWNTDGSRLNLQRTGSPSSLPAPRAIRCASTDGLSRRPVWKSLPEAIAELRRQEAVANGAVAVESECFHGEIKANLIGCSMDEGRKRTIRIRASILGFAKVCSARPAVVAGARSGDRRCRRGGREDPAKDWPPLGRAAGSDDDFECELSVEDAPVIVRAADRGPSARCRRQEPVAHEGYSIPLICMKQSVQLPRLTRSLQ